MKQKKSCLWTKRVNSGKHRLQANNNSALLYAAAGVAGIVVDKAAPRCPLVLAYRKPLLQQGPEGGMLFAFVLHEKHDAICGCVSTVDVQHTI